jgi:hypothetical protein
MLLLAVFAANDYDIIARGKVCPESDRLRLPCGNCGPGWGELQDCEDECNFKAACTHITYYEDKGCRIYSGCDLQRREAPDYQVGTDIYKRNNPVPVTRPDGPCDILAAAGTPCVAAHSVVRVLFANYTGPLYRVIRRSDLASIDVGASLEGLARSADQDTFCAQSPCSILRIYDQSPMGNDLDTAPPGGACHRPLSPVTADKEPITIGNRSVYGAYFEGNMGAPSR